MRDLFGDAENEQRTRGIVSPGGRGANFYHYSCLCFLLTQILLLYPSSGDESDLHVIIFDEIDAICKVNHLLPSASHPCIFPLISSSP